MDNEEIVRKFKKCLSSIVSGAADEVNDGWAKLNELEEIFHDSTQQPCDIDNILRDILNGQELNLYEVPLLLAWFSKYSVKISLETNPISNDVATFLRNSNIKDISLLTSVTQVLLEHKIYLPASANHTKLCEAVVACLESLPMPLEPEKISEFNDNAAKIQTFLTSVHANTKSVEKDNLIIMCLEVLYKIISDTERKREPGPALVVVLQLVEPSVIPQAVRWILSESCSDQRLVQALKVLCVWLPKWPRRNCLSLWIMEFIRGLEMERKFYVLNKVADATLEYMFNSLILPMARQNLAAIVFHILKRQNSPILFHKIVKKIQYFLSYLEKDNSESGKEYVQCIVDVTKVLMMRFPGYPIYETLQNSLPVTPRMDVVYEMLNESVWSEDNEERESQIIYGSNSGKVGLTNLGNTCYMNSVLQALVMTRQFCQETLNYKFSVEADDQVVLKKLQNLFALLLYSRRISLAPNEILLASRPAYFMPGQQQDSSEFLCHLLDILYEQEKSADMHCSIGDPIASLKSKDEEQTSDRVMAEGETEGIIKRWTTEEDLTGGIALQRKTQSLADFTQGEDLAQQLSDSHSDSTDSGIQSVGGEEASTQSFLVHRVFGGESKVTYQCTQCNTSSHNTDKFRDLQLCFPEEIHENQEVSVQDLINYYLTPEKLTGENKYRCDKCTKLCDAQRLIKVLQAPSHLILTLKHFHYDSETRLRTKLRHKVIYNESILLPISAQSSAVNETYQLYAAVVHSGYSMDYGHYFTYACDSKQNWYKFNDSYVTRTTLEDFKNLEPPDTPYILFYQRIATSEGVCEEDKPELSSLCKRIQKLVANDLTTYIEELRYQAEKKRPQRGRHSVPLLRRYDNSDDENPPPSSCRSAVDIPANRFLF